MFLHGLKAKVGTLRYEPSKEGLPQVRQRDVGKPRRVKSTEVGFSISLSEFPGVVCFG